MRRGRRLAVVGLVGFASGLPLYLTGQTLSAWLTAERVDYTTIGAFALVGLPYSLKWLWAPLFDRYSLPLGRRRGWLVGLGLALAAAIAAMGTRSPTVAPVTLAGLALAVAFLSASFDVVVDAYKADLLGPGERVAGAAAAVTGYRVAMVVSGTAALALADHVSWRVIYGAMAGLMAIAALACGLAPEPLAPSAPPARLADALWRPLAALLRRPRVLVLLGFVALFRLGDALAQTVVIPFLRDGAGFSFGQIATLYHLTGLGGTIVGGALAAALVRRWSLRRALVVFGALQALANLGYLGVIDEPSLARLVAAVVVDNLANAMGAAAFVAFLMGQCERAYSATQFAVLTSLSSLGGRLFGFAAAALAAAAGWSALWLATAAIALPGLLLVAALPALPDDAPGPATVPP